MVKPKELNDDSPLIVDLTQDSPAVQRISRSAVVCVNLLESPVPNLSHSTNGATTPTRAGRPDIVAHAASTPSVWSSPPPLPEPIDCPDFVALSQVHHALHSADRTFTQGTGPHGLVSNISRYSDSTSEQPVPLQHSPSPTAAKSVLSDSPSSSTRAYDAENPATLSTYLQHFGGSRKRPVNDPIAQDTEQDTRNMLEDETPNSPLSCSSQATEILPDISTLENVSALGNDIEDSYTSTYPCQENNPSASQVIRKASTLLEDSDSSSDGEISSFAARLQALQDARSQNSTTNTSRAQSQPPDPPMANIDHATAPALPPLPENPTLAESTNMDICPINSPPIYPIFRRTASASVVDRSPNTRLSKEERARLKLLEKERKAQERALAKEERARKKREEQQIRKANQIRIDKLECSREMVVCLDAGYYEIPLTTAEQDGILAFLQKSNITFTKKVDVEALLTSAENTNSTIPTTLGAYIEWSLGLYLHSRVAKVQDTPAHVVYWHREVKNRFDHQQGMFLPISEPRVVPEDVLVVWWTIDDLNHWVNNADGLKDLRFTLQSCYGHIRTTILILQGYEAWMRKQRQRHDRDFARQVRQATIAENPGTSGASMDNTDDPVNTRPSRRRRRQPANQETSTNSDEVTALSPEKAEEFLVRIQISTGWLIQHARNVHESVQWITVYTRDIGARRYKDRTKLCPEVDTTAETISCEQNADSNGIGELQRSLSLTTNVSYSLESGIARSQTEPSAIWLHVLLQIPKVTQSVAQAITQQYPTLQSLYLAYKQVESVEAGKALLADVVVPSTRSAASGDTDDFRIWPSIRDEFLSHTPLQHVICKLPPHTTSKFIPALPVNLVEWHNRGLTGSPLPSGLAATPYLNLYFSHCEDVDTYRQLVKAKIKQWLDPIASKKNQEWLIIHVTRQLPDNHAKSGGAKLFPRATSVVDKIRADFSPKKDDNRVLLLHFGDDGHNDPETWHDVFARIKECVVQSFYRRVTHYQEDVRRLDAQRMMPGWNYCTFFILKERVVHCYQQMGMYDEALKQYDELEASFFQLLKDRALTWFTSFGGTTVGDDNTSLLDFTKKEYRERIVQNHITVFDLRMYLFGRQCQLLIQLHQIREFLERCRKFVPGFKHAIEEFEKGLSTVFLTAWMFSTYKNVVDICETIPTPPIPTEAYDSAEIAAIKAEFLGNAKVQLDKLG
ncbi:hypothetical protein IWQ62_004566, partial [Dispira parvispora]